jgi:predicted RNase H-like nuclease
MISLTKLIGFSRSWSAKSSTMLAIKREDIKAEIERLEKALRDCSDSGIRRVIEEWIADAKRRLVSGQESK